MGEYLLSIITLAIVFDILELFSAESLAGSREKISVVVAAMRSAIRLPQRDLF